MKISEENYLEHYGILRRSGRYPWGSGGSVTSRSMKFLDHVAQLRSEGLSDTEIARGFGMSTTDFRALNSIAKNEKKQAQISQAQRLKDKGYSNVAIGQKMGLNESSVRALLAPGAQDKADILQATTEMLRQQVAEKTYLDIGKGTENHLEISPEKLKTAVAVLEQEGYTIHYVKVPQLGTTHETTLKVLAPPGTKYSEVAKHKGDIRTVTSFSDDGGRSFYGILPPLSINPDRVAVRYGDEGGSQTDGVIYVRPGVKDTSLGNARYAQVRIQVGDSHYLKGMAMYKDDLPDGVDLLFNTNKTREETGPDKFAAMKKLSDDPDNPFGAVVRQRIERDADGKERVTSVMNIVGSKEGAGEEGSWSGWSKSISSQMLSKQSPKLAEQQLSVTFENRKKELDEIMALTNPTVRRTLLKEFADGTDSAAVHLDAAGLPRQGWHVILPIDSMPNTQIYAPRYRDGERVVLIRYPHAGTFEIPELIVNNNQPEAKRILGEARDAVGIHHSVAERLSGADFDGDTVLVIPNNSNKVKTSPALEQLRGFDPRSEYKAYEGMPRMTARQKGIEMGSVSNLITDMTIKGASHEKLARAVKHSMVVIDAEKHHLDYKRSAIENGIPALKEEYQGRANAGAATLISRATAEVRVPDRKDRPASEGGSIDRTTGKRVFVETGKTNFRTGRPVTIKSKRLAETDDAFTLSSGTRMETVYADHSNRLKKMANDARLELVNTPLSKYSPSAAKTYASEVKTLTSKLSVALRNAPLERQAQVLGNAVVKMKRDADPSMDAPTLKKIKYQALEEARTRTGAKKQRIVITDSEWDAIQAGAVSDNKLSKILVHADMDRVRELATPRTQLLMTPAKTQLAASLLNAGYTRSEVADRLGVSLTTLDTATG